MINLNRGKPARQARLAHDLLVRALGLGDRFDLDALKNPKSYALATQHGTGLRRGQLLQVPKFAADVQNVSDYDHEVVEITERQAAKDKDLASNMDHWLARTSAGARTTSSTLTRSGRS